MTDTPTPTTWIHPEAAKIVMGAFNRVRADQGRALQRRDNRDKFNRKRNPRGH